MLKKIAGATVIAGALGWSALGLGAGLANATPIAQVVPGSVYGAPLPADDGGGWWGHGGHGHGGWGHGGWGGGWGRGGDWDGGWGGGPGWGWGGGPGWGGGGGFACGSVGWVSGCIG